MRTFNVLASSRQTGKTTWAIGWIFSGHSISGYPGWSRVLLVQDQIMKRNIEDKLHQSIPRDAVQVYDHWKSSMQNGVSSEVEIMIDDAELILQAGLFNRVSGCTISTSAPTCTCE